MKNVILVLGLKGFGDGGNKEILGMVDVDE